MKEVDYTNAYAMALAQFNLMQIKQENELLKTTAGATVSIPAYNFLPVSRVENFAGDDFYQTSYEERLEIFANVPELRDIYNRLAEYEDTGLTPEQISAKNKLAHWSINPDGYYPQCSNCGYEPPRELIRRNGDALIFPRYCPECGSDTKREVR